LTATAAAVFLRVAIVSPSPLATGSTAGLREVERDFVCKINQECKLEAGEYLAGDNSKFFPTITVWYIYDVGKSRVMAGQGPGV
jgi:hypothetical protein